MTLITCPRCQHPCIPAAFVGLNGQPTKWCAHCRDGYARRQRAYRNRHPERIPQQRRAYYQAHRQHCVAYSAAWKARWSRENPELRAEEQYQYRQRKGAASGAEQSLTGCTISPSM